MFLGQKYVTNWKHSMTEDLGQGSWYHNFFTKTRSSKNFYKKFLDPHREPDH